MKRALIIALLLAAACTDGDSGSLGTYNGSTIATFDDADGGVRCYLVGDLDHRAISCVKVRP